MNLFIEMEEIDDKNTIMGLINLNTAFHGGLLVQKTISSNLEKRLKKEENERKMIKSDYDSLVRNYEKKSEELKLLRIQIKEQKDLLESAKSNIHSVEKGTRFQNNSRIYETQGTKFSYGETMGRDYRCNGQKGRDSL
jgi:hypothetical protein